MNTDDPCASSPNNQHNTLFSKREPKQFPTPIKITRFDPLLGYDIIGRTQVRFYYVFVFDLYSTRIKGQYETEWFCTFFYKVLKLTRSESFYRSIYDESRVQIFEGIVVLTQKHETEIA